MVSVCADANRTMSVQVNSRPNAMCGQGPLYPELRTFACAAGMSQMGHNPTLALQNFGFSTDVIGKTTPQQRPCGAYAARRAG
jgi:hypothetical protein